MKHLLFSCSLFVSVLVNAQPSERIYLLDSMINAGAKSHTHLNDSVSYLYLHGDSVEMRGVWATGKFFERGKIIRWTETTGADGQRTYRFYMAKRGVLKGTLTMTIQERSSGDHLIHVVSPFATFDRKFEGHIGDMNNIIRPPRKKAKPKRKK